MLDMNCHESCMCHSRTENVKTIFFSFQNNNSPFVTMGGGRNVLGMPDRWKIHFFTYGTIGYCSLRIGMTQNAKLPVMIASTSKLDNMRIRTVVAVAYCKGRLHHCSSIVSKSYSAHTTLFQNVHNVKRQSIARTTLLLCSVVVGYKLSACLGRDDYE
jgi:hypothetical protein